MRCPACQCCPLVLTLSLLRCTALPQQEAATAAAVEQQQQPSLNELFLLVCALHQLLVLR